VKKLLATRLRLFVLLVFMANTASSYAFASSLDSWIHEVDHQHLAYDSGHFGADVDTQPLYDHHDSCHLSHHLVPLLNGEFRPMLASISRVYSICSRCSVVGTTAPPLLRPPKA